jgi:hypothetical protein
MNKTTTDRAWNFDGSTENDGILRPVCLQVESHFSLPPKRLWRYFATSDDSHMQTWMGLGEHYRGFHIPFSGRSVLPHYLLYGFFHPLQSGMTYEDSIAFDNLIYIRQSTCSDLPVGFVTAYAHELQHFVQYGRTPKLWDVNRNLYHSIGAFEPNMIPSEIPSERDADITAKRIAEQVCGVEATNQFAEQQIQSMENCGASVQKARWVFFRNVPSATHYDLVRETLPFIDKYQGRIDFGVDTKQPEWWNTQP